MQWSLLTFLIFYLTGISYGQTIDVKTPNTIIDIISRDDGTLTLLSKDGKLISYDGVDFTQSYSGLSNASRLLIDNEELIVLTDKGVHIHGDSHQDYYPIGEPVIDYITIRKDRMLITSTGLYKLRDGRFQLENSWTKDIYPSANFVTINKDHFFLNGNEMMQSIGNEWKVIARDTALLHDADFFDDHIWLATDSGLKIVKDKSIKQVVIDGIDSKAPINQLYADKDDLLYQSLGTVYSWSTLDYHNSIIGYHNDNSSIVKDNWGDMWWSVGKKLVRYNKSNKIDKPVLSKVNVSINGNLKNGNNIVVDQPNQDLKISYQANHLKLGRQIKYQSMLSPLDASYRELTTDKSVFYSDLPAGNYKYRLRATVDSSDFVYSKPIEITVKSSDNVSPWWYGLLALSLGLLALAFISNYRLQQYKEKSDLLTAKLRTTNQLLQAQQKTMQLQMNPHFLFNALNSIQALVTLNRSDEAKIYLRTFSRMMRSVLDFSRVDKIDLQTEIDYLKDYMSIEKMTRSDNFDFEIHIENSLLEDDIKLPPMIIQPFVENAIVHGVASIKYGKIIVDVTDNEDKLHVSIIDNGVGRVAAAKRKSSSHDSVAISLSRERILNLSKSNISNPIVYTDLYNENKKAVGTKVEIVIPI